MIHLVPMVVFPEVVSGGLFSNLVCIIHISDGQLVIYLVACAYGVFPRISFRSGDFLEFSLYNSMIRLSPCDIPQPDWYACGL